MHAPVPGHTVGFEDSGVVVHGNLLDNALYYGERAEIAVRRHDGRVEIAVRDHGPGVPQDAIASLFEPYVRLSHGRSRNDTGLGLGLGIARSIVEAHRGQLVLGNHPEGGLVATIVLPAEQPVDAAEPAHS